VSELRFPLALLALAAALVLRPATLLAAAPVPDPTRPAIALPSPGLPPTAGAAVAAAPVLQFTRVAPGRSSAIVDGRRVRPGDRIGDARVAAIGPGWLRLESTAGTTELRLSHSSFVRPVNR